VNYVVAAYAITIVLLGTYAWSVHLRRRAVEREIASLTEPQTPTTIGEGDPSPQEGVAGDGGA